MTAPGQSSAQLAFCIPCTACAAPQVVITEGLLELMRSDPEATSALPLHSLSSHPLLATVPAAEQGSKPHFITLVFGHVCMNLYAPRPKPGQTQTAEQQRAGSAHLAL